jgi:hypothetical protein
MKNRLLPSGSMTPETQLLLPKPLRHQLLQKYQTMVNSSQTLSLELASTVYQMPLKTLISTTSELSTSLAPVLRIPPSLAVSSLKEMLKEALIGW